MKHELDAGYWNKRYQDCDTAWDLGAISTPLKTYFDQLTNKGAVILIPGAGNAYEAEYLVKNGHANVYVCDFAELAIKNLKKRIPALDPAHVIQADFFELKQQNFDLVIEQTFFCALHPSLRQKYFQKMHELLKPGGQLVGLLFEDKLNDDKPPFGGNRNEYAAYFNGLFAIKTFETAYNSIPPREGRELFINLVKI